MNFNARRYPDFLRGFEISLCFYYILDGIKSARSPLSEHVLLIQLYLNTIKTLHKIMCTQERLCPNDGYCVGSAGWKTLVCVLYAGKD